MRFVYAEVGGDEVEVDLGGLFVSEGGVREDMGGLIAYAGFGELFEDAPEEGDCFLVGWHTEELGWECLMLWETDKWCGKSRNGWCLVWL